MAKTKRLCRREARAHNRSDMSNYSSDKMYAKAKKRRTMQKAARKANR